MSVFLGTAMGYAVPACIWGFEGFEGCPSLKDLCTLSATRKVRQEPVLVFYSTPFVRQLVEALKSSVPDLAAALEVQDSTSQLLHQLWTVDPSCSNSNHGVQHSHPPQVFLWTLNSYV